MFIRIGKQIWKEVIYALALLIYLFNLQQLNKKLVAQNLSSVEIVMYNNFEPLKYFGGAFVFFAMGIFMAYLVIKRMKEDIHNPYEMLIGAAELLILLILLIMIIIFIDNPILRAVLTVALAVSALMFSND
ncbi:hypothetical protein [Pygmaiobacter massiliensis]|uniref:hypothetical protein n=1 Tax=Pygmaiobacter massiliensis TaxID=1917873 RepID=UPI000C7E16BA|nr:hypothetical protein [Pygmaiobacter massiliensis]